MFACFELCLIVFSLVFRLLVVCRLICACYARLVCLLCFLWFGLGVFVCLCVCWFGLS